MKYLLILIALIVTIGCSNSNPQPNPNVTPTPTPVATASPTPVASATPVQVMSWASLEDVKTYAHQRSNILVVNMLDGSVQKFVPILPSPMPPTIPQMEVVEQADHSFKLK